MINLLSVFEQVLFGNNGELARLRWALISIILATAIASIVILASEPSISTCFWIMIFPWIFSAYRLYSIRRFISVHLTGETLELLSALLVKPEESGPGNGPFDNAFIRAYLAAITGIFFFQTGLFLILPLYVNCTSAGITPILIAVMSSAVILISFPRFFVTTAKVAVIVFAFVYIFGLVVYLLPQTEYYLGLNNIRQALPRSSAKVISDTNELRRQQREAMNNATLAEAKEWQGAHPGQELPGFYKEVMEAASFNLSLEEFRRSEAEAGKSGVFMRTAKVFDGNGNTVPWTARQGIKVVAIGRTKGMDGMTRIMLPDCEWRFSRKSNVVYVHDEGEIGWN